MLTLPRLSNVILHDNKPYIQNVLNDWFCEFYPLKTIPVATFQVFPTELGKKQAREVAIASISVATTFITSCIIQWINQPFNQSVLQISDITRIFNFAIPLFSTKLQEYKTKLSVIKIKAIFYVWFLCLNADINPSLVAYVNIHEQFDTVLFRVSNETFRSHSRKPRDTCPV